jgi:hypothetical protein
MILPDDGSPSDRRIRGDIGVKRSRRTIAGMRIAVYNWSKQGSTG